MTSEAVSALSQADLSRVVRRIPSDIRKIMQAKPGVFVAGGFVRAVIAGEKVNDIDMFGPSVAVLSDAANTLKRDRENTRLHRTKNATTVISLGRTPIQFIHRWTFGDIQSCVASFDYTVCQAAIGVRDGKFVSVCHRDFYQHLAARVLVYTRPVREEEAGGSLLRAIKYVQRGYHLPVNTLAAVTERLVSAYEQGSPVPREQVLRGLLREVDPNLAIDGLDVHDDHETPIEGLDE